MKIALVQLLASFDPYWNVEGIGKILSQVEEDVDLVVFPEGMPFHVEKGEDDIEVAKRQLAAIKSDIAFIAGGYVKDGKDGVRNASFLVHKGEVNGTYFKRVAWQKEGGINTTKADVDSRFDWGDGFSCIPLICADASEAEAKGKFTAMVNEAIQSGAGPNTPIIITSYGDCLAEPYWLDSLYAWAETTGAPVAICGVAGRSTATYTEGKKQFNYGGGGSTVVWPSQRKTENGVVSWQPAEQTEQSDRWAIYYVDLAMRNEDVKVVSLKEPKVRK